MYPFTRSVTADQVDRMASADRKVVRRTRSRLMPSIPIW